MNSPIYTMRLPKEWHDAITEDAERKGLTKSQWLRDAIEKKLPKAASRKLPAVKHGPKQK